jgi:hypothetical protein
MRGPRRLQLDGARRAAPNAVEWHAKGYFGIGHGIAIVWDATSRSKGYLILAPCTETDCAALRGHYFGVSDVGQSHVCSQAGQKHVVSP